MKHKILRIIFKPIKVFFIIAFSLFILYFIFLFYLSYYSNQYETKIKLGEYNIKCFSEHDIIHRGKCFICKEGTSCLTWSIKGLNEINNKTYIYAPQRGRDISEGLLNKEDIEDLNNYIVIENGELKEYSSKTIKNLTIEEQEIFIGLEKEPKIIIDGIVQD